MTFRQLRVMLAVVVLAALFGAGCGSQGKPATKQPPSEDRTAQVAAAGDSSGAGTKPVLMLGRSVMWGWFKHWGWDGSIESMPLAKNGYSLTYREIATPPDIAASAAGFMEEAPEGSVVFFKFCFDDFPGGEDAVARFEQQKEWVAQVAAKAEERGQPLIIGNALPKVSAATDPTLVAEHKEFNAWLEEFANGSGGKVRVYDFYGMLAAPDGALTAEYATSADDSHPNDEGYSQLDPSLFSLLDEVTG